MTLKNFLNPRIQGIPWRQRKLAYLVSSELPENWANSIEFAGSNLAKMICPRCDRKYHRRALDFLAHISICGELSLDQN